MWAVFGDNLNKIFPLHAKFLLIIMVFFSFFRFVFAFPLFVNFI